MFMSPWDTSLAKFKDFLNVDFSATDVVVMHDKDSPAFPTSASSSSLRANSDPRFCFICSLFRNLEPVLIGVRIPGVEGTSMLGEPVTPELVRESLLGVPKRDRMADPCFTGVAAGDLKPS
jgi:hypothetical protein